MYCIGLTGNIASGKSTVAAIFRELGVPVISADKIARNLAELDADVSAAIHKRFGTLDRRRLREIIFADDKERIWLEQLLHPAIRQKIVNELQELSSPVAVVEIPVLPERELYPWVDRFVVVVANPVLQIEYLIKRDTCTEEMAQMIINAQASPESYQAIADDIIINNYDYAELEAKITELYREIMASLGNSSQ